MKKILLLLFLNSTILSKAQTFLMDNTPVTTCTGIFYDSGGSAGNYGNSQNFTKVFTPSTVGQGISLNFTSINLQAPFDYLEIFDGPTVSSPLIGTFSGTTNIGAIVASTHNSSGSLTVRFMSNGSGNSSGWAANISCVSKGTPQYAMDNQPLTVCNGIFTDPGGQAQEYYNSQSLTKTIFPGTPGLGVSLTFSLLQLELYFDRIEIFDGPNVTSPLLCQVTGTVSLGQVSASNINPTGALTIRFTSNGSNVRRGWVANISCITKNTPIYAMQNGATINGCDYYISDSGGPNSDYGWNDNVTTTYCPPAGMCARLSISTVSIEPLGDKLTVFDGPSTTHPLITTFHTSTSTSGDIIASKENTSGCLTLNFREDGWTLMPGWTGTVTCVTCDEIQKLAMQNRTTNTCESIFTDDGGTFDNYLNAQNIVQTICSDDTANYKYMSVTFDEIRLENNLDRLWVYDGATTLYPLISVLTGSINNYEVTATNNTGCLTFHFISNNVGTLPGWTARTSCVRNIGLPIELVEFKGEFSENGSIVLAWHSLSEYNSEYYNIEKSGDGINFKTIGTIQATGKSDGYRYIDYEPIAPISYYRLKMVDKDSTYSYSKITALDYIYINTEVNIYPNPCQNYLNIFTNSKQDENLHIELKNSLGETIISNNLGLVNDQNIFSIDLSQYKPGVYILNIKKGSTNYAYKVMIVN